MRLVLLGPPGAGKGTQAQRLGLAHISTGDMLRAAVRDGTSLGREAKTFMDAGELVPDALIVGVLVDALPEDRFVLDGFPRTVAQAVALKRAGCEVDHVVQIETPDEEVVRRIAGRAAEAAVARRDDTEETARARLAVYHEQTAPVAEFYASEGLLRRVDGTGSPDDVHARISSALCLA
jgi:adenylate kinase